MLSAVLVVSLMISLLAGCASKTSSGSSDSSTAATSSASSTTGGALKKITLQLKWLPQSQFMGYYIAAAQGSGPERFVDERISGGDFVPAPDGYYREAHASLAVLLSGGIPGAWEIG